MAQELRIGIVGAGGIVRTRHMPALRKIPGVRITAVANLHAETAKRFAKDFQVPRIHDDWRELVADSQVDIVWIGAWPHLHCPVTVAALRAGKHVFTQARMARDLAEARQMAQAAREHPDCVTMICPPPHGLSGDRVMRRLLRDERYCGQVLQVRLAALTSQWIDPAAPMTWRKDEELSGQNVLTLGIYAEVLHRWLGDHSSVTAAFDTWTRLRPDAETGETRQVVIPDAVRIVARLASGAGAVYHVSGLCPVPPDETLEIYGSAGTLVYNFKLDKIYGNQAGSRQLPEIEIGAERREWTVEEDFIEAVRTGDRSRIEPTFEQGVKYMAFLDAVWRSAESGQATELPTE